MTFKNSFAVKEWAFRPQQQKPSHPTLLRRHCWQKLPWKGEAGFSLVLGVRRR